jgi:two-component system LytT family response regulator
MAIMFTDIVGYTSIMQENEDAARAVRDRCEEVVSDTVRAYTGEPVQLYGDGVLSVFTSAIQAVECAREIQRRVGEIPDASLRIGIHVGDVIYEAGSVVGDAVNVASRVQGVAPPGGVCVSEKVYDEIKNQPGLEAASLGLYSLKNVKRQVEIFALTSEGLSLPKPKAARILRAIIVDDEDLARKVLREYLASHKEVEVVKECANGFEAVKAITELSPDLVFLDIQMPKLNGFEVIELIEKKPTVIFTTAYDEYALKAFEVHAVDYLLKPFSQERLDEALRHVEGMSGATPESTRIHELVTAARGQAFPAERILIREGSKVHIVHAEDIDYIEARDDYAAIRTRGKDLLKQTTLSALEEELDPRTFVRIHRSYILNIDRLAKVELYAKDSRVAILNDGARLQVSRAGYARLKELL